MEKQKFQSCWKKSFQMEIGLAICKMHVSMLICHLFLQSAETKLNWFHKHVVQETVSGMEKEQATQNGINSKQ